MARVSVDLNEPTPYIEPSGRFYRFRRKLTFAFAFKLINQFSTRSRIQSILEIGTGSGYFLSSCHDRFPRAKLFGIEYDERLLEESRSRATNAQCSQGNAETFCLLPEKFDVIVSFQVIEHLFNPSEMLNRVREHLNPGGLFIVTSPNLEGIGAKIMGSNWHGYRDDHVSLKSAKEWVSIIEGHGFHTRYAGSTFFSGIPVMNRAPLGFINWGLLLLFGSAKWDKGESFVGAFTLK